MRIDVTAEDIVKGEPSNCDQCPVALAITRQTGISVSVSNRTIHKAAGRTPTTGATERFIRRFDALEARGPSRLLYIEPFSFELPDAFLSTIAP